MHFFHLRLVNLDQFFQVVSGNRIDCPGSTHYWISIGLIGEQCLVKQVPGNFTRRTGVAAKHAKHRSADIFDLIGIESRLKQHFTKEVKPSFGKLVDSFKFHKRKATRGIAIIIRNPGVIIQRHICPDLCQIIGQLAGGVAHDFNNLLTGILGQAELALLELDTHGPCQERVRGIHQAAIRAAELTSQLLDYTGRSPIVIRPIDLSALVGEMNHLLHAAVDRRAEVHLRLAPDLPPVEGDEKQLRQVVLALATNAAETMSTSGRIHISTHLVPAGAPLPGRGRDESTVATGDMVAISVHDEGEGIPPSVFPSIFDPFFSTKATGRGLGLAAADGIMRSHDGQLRVSSQPGGGATFVVLLPAARPPEGGAASADPHRNQSASVLLIDDEEIIIEVTQAILEHSGYQVAATRNGAEAVRLVQSGQISPDVILLDMVMPGEGGRAIRDALVAAGYAGPIVLCSGYASDSASTTFQQQGFAGYLAKPYGAAELLAVVGEMLAS